MAALKILIADDSAQIRMMVRGALENLGYEFVEAVDGADALDKVIAEQPDLMLLDITMPELDGFEVLDFMSSRAECAKTKVLLLTGSTDAGNEEYGYTMGALGYIVKPFVPEDLRTAVARALTSPW
jgi:two-component system, chemotaxis family, chemotaxis protein CheY